MEIDTKMKRSVSPREFTVSELGLLANFAELVETEQIRRIAARNRPTAASSPTIIQNYRPEQKNVETV
jgi:hypothetical protein